MVEKRRARDASGPLLPAEPSSDELPRAVKRRRRRRQGELATVKREPEKAGPLGHDRPELRDNDANAHSIGRDWCDLTLVSSPTDKNAPTKSDTMDEVAAHRSEKYRAQMEGVGRRIKFQRQEAGLSQHELARKSGVDRTTITRLESGELLEISAGRLFDLCDALVLDPVYVWTGQKRGDRRRGMPSSVPPPSAERPSERPKRG